MRVLRFPEATRRHPAIDAWLSGKPDALYSMARRWFTYMRECGDDVRELLHDGHPTACVHDASFGYVDVFSAHVNVGFFNGTALEDPAGLLQGTGRFMRHVKLVPGSEPDPTALSALITAAYLDMKTREEASREP